MFSVNSLLWYVAHILLVVFGLFVNSANLFTEFVGEALNVGISGSLVAAGGAGAFLYATAQVDENRRKLVEGILLSGVKKIFPGRSVTIREEYSSRIDKAHEIDVMGFGLSSFRQDYLDKFSSMATSKKIRILLANPAYPSADLNYCRQRDSEEGNPEGQIAADIEKFIAETEEIREKFKHNFSIRKMKVLPSINVFRMDGNILWGPYVISDQSRNMPTILVGQEGYFYSVLKSHFDKIWESDEFSEQV